MKPIVRWGALWRSENRLCGERRHLMCDNCLPVLFRTKKECRAWIKEKYGYIRWRAELRAERHGWRMPIAILVSIIPSSEGP